MAPTDAATPPEPHRTSPDLMPIVLRARSDFAARRIDPLLLADLYAREVTVPNVTEFVADGLRLFPALCCGLASAYLRHILGTGSVVRGRFGGENHTVLEIAELGVIVDITADQFGGPPVYVGPWAAPWNRVALPAAAVRHQIEGRAADH